MRYDEQGSIMGRKLISCGEDQWSHLSLGLRFSYCPPISKWVSGSNNVEIKVVSKGTGHPTSLAYGLE